MSDKSNIKKNKYVLPNGMKEELFAIIAQFELCNYQDPDGMGHKITNNIHFVRLKELAAMKEGSDTTAFVVCEVPTGMTLDEMNTGVEILCITGSEDVAEAMCDNSDGKDYIEVPIKFSIHG